jgi:hypothetical protein
VGVFALLLPLNFQFVNEKKNTDYASVLNAFFHFLFLHNVHEKHWRTQRGGLGVQTPPEIIPKFSQSRAEFPVPWKIDLKNLIRIRVPPICELGETPD